MMSAARRHTIAAGLVFALFTASTAAFAECRVAFDMGSSGIRAGASNSAETRRAEIDYLGPLWARRGLDETLAPTIEALRELPAKAGFADDCQRAAGGFSAWRLALQQDANKLAVALRRIHAESGVALLVMPQLREGAYGYLGARQLLGDRLTTSHVLDIGGGSLQVAGERTTYGEPLGQKVVQRYLCQEIRNSENAPCTLQPLTGEELAIARSLLREKLAGVAPALPETVTMTAISRPVSRGVAPAVARLAGEGAAPTGFRRAALSRAIERIANLTQAETAAAVGSPAAYVAYLLSDMLLVEGLLQATGGDELQVAELDLTNLPGLLSDDRLFDWAGHYGCYLDRLPDLGLAAYASDPASCP